jgi:hypothetical protein
MLDLMAAAATSEQVLQKLKVLLEEADESPGCGRRVGFVGEPSVRKHGSTGG